MRVHALLDSRPLRRFHDESLGSIASQPNPVAAPGGKEWDIDRWRAVRSEPSSDMVPAFDHEARVLLAFDFHLAEENRDERLASVLLHDELFDVAHVQVEYLAHPHAGLPKDRDEGAIAEASSVVEHRVDFREGEEIGRASCRERV